jgi:hypothetical protein
MFSDDRLRSMLSSVTDDVTPRPLFMDELWDVLARERRRRRGRLQGMSLPLAATLALLLLLIVALLAMWGNQNPLPTASAEASGTLTPTDPFVPTQAPQGKIEVGQILVTAWTPAGGGDTTYEVLVELRNTGQGWARANASGANYRVKDAAGASVIVSQFSYALPDVIEPGGTGYLYDRATLNSATPADFATAELVTRDFDAWPEPAVTFAITDITWKAGPAGNDLVATGTITVTGNRTVDRVAAAVVCIGASGEVLGATLTKELVALAPGVVTPFETIDGTPPLDAAQCVTTVGVAVDRGPDFSG